MNTSHLSLKRIGFSTCGGILLGAVALSVRACCAALPCCNRAGIFQDLANWPRSTCGGWKANLESFSLSAKVRGGRVLPTVVKVHRLKHLSLRLHHQPRLQDHHPKKEVSKEAEDQCLVPKSKPASPPKPCGGARKSRALGRRQGLEGQRQGESRIIR